MHESRVDDRLVLPVCMLLWTHTDVNWLLNGAKSSHSSHFMISGWKPPGNSYSWLSQLGLWALGKQWTKASEREMLKLSTPWWVPEHTVLKPSDALYFLPHASRATGEKMTMYILGIGCLSQFNICIQFPPCSSQCHWIFRCKRWALYPSEISPPHLARVSD